MKNRILSIVFLLSIVFGSCKEDRLEKISETIVTGNIKEGNSLKPITGVKVYIWKYKRTDDFYKPQTYREKIVDSTVTDILGNYSVSFKSTVDAAYYMPNFELGREYYFMYPSIKLQRGMNNIYDLMAYQSCILKAIITYSDNPYPPLKVYNNSEVNPSWTLSSFTINRVKGDTTLFIKLIPNKENYLTFSYSNGYTPFFYSETIRPPRTLDTVFRNFNLNPISFKR